MATNKTNKTEYNRLYMRKYREKNKEHYNEYQRNWRKKNKKHYNDYSNKYYIEHKEEMQKNAKKYFTKFDGYFLYIITDINNNIKYVGETTNIKTRLSNHLCFNSNIKKHLQENKWKYIKYLDISNLVENKNELRLLENELIELYQPAWNKSKNIVKEIAEERKFELICNIHNLTNVWQIYATNV